MQDIMWKFINLQMQKQYTQINQLKNEIQAHKHTYYIYRIKCVCECFYIGRTKNYNERIQSHKYMSCNTSLQKHIYQCSGLKNLFYDLIHKYEYTEEESIIIEKRYISKYYIEQPDKLINKNIN